MKASKGQGIKITPGLKKKIIEIVDERIREAHVTKEDFSELKAIVRELAEAQKRTEIKVEELAEAQKRTEERLEELAEAQKRTEQRVEELAEAQKRTEQRVEELAEAQKRTEQRVEELAEAQKKTEEKLADLTEEVRKLAQGLNRTREDLGGLARSFSYAFENEAYRMLPGVLTRYGIEVDEKIVRAEVGGKEINFFGKARKNGREVFIVGEVKLRLDDTKKREDAFEELEEKVEAVRKEYGDVEVVRLLVTHFATKGFLKKAEKRGVIVVQSYEW
jgi:DNA repair exonuclease SbcCD ATPase subunit